MLCNTLGIEPCKHNRAPGAKRCKSCNSAYFREYYKTRQSLAVRNAERKGLETGLQIARLELLKAGDRTLSGFTAAEIVRKLGLD